MKGKKAQEEMVGFVIIMVVVLVILVIILGLYIRQSSSAQKIDNTEISQFLSSALEYTTNCEVAGSFLQLNELTQRCYEGKSCGSESACDITRETFQSLIESSWKFSLGTLSYKFTILNPSGDEIVILRSYQTETSSSQSIEASKLIPAGSEDILVSLRIS